MIQADANPTTLPTAAQSGQARRDLPHEQPPSGLRALWADLGFVLAWGPLLLISAGAAPGHAWPAQALAFVGAGGGAAAVIGLVVGLVALGEWRGVR